MIVRPDLQALDPTRRATILYSEARAELENRLWQAALGREEVSLPRPTELTRRTDFSSLLVAEAPSRATEEPPAPAWPAEPTGKSEVAVRAHGLGPNAGYVHTLAAASERTGIPAAALASIVDAEAAKGSGGAWNVRSRNPRSSAAGLGQFLAGTWVGEAERTGTWLNGVASAQGWLNAAGRVRGEARAELLALRYKGDAAIHAIADYARLNLDRLRGAGVTVDGSAAGLARAAYLGHHLGPGDAVRFLRDGALGAAHARRLLSAQIGSAAAARRIEQVGNPASAHRGWLLAYIDRKIRPERFG